MKPCGYFLLFIAFIGSVASEGISAKKCTEFSQTPHSRNCHHRVSPLLGYRPAVANEFPHTALLGAEKDTTHHSHIEWFCTGVLISHDYVLALAECGFVFLMKEATHVRLGDFNYGSNKEILKPLNVKIAEVILHPKYTKKSLYDNLALVQLQQSVKFGLHIRPACLPQMFEIAEQTVSMTGWPFKLYSVPRSLRYKQDMTLRKYNMNPIDFEECKKIFGPHDIKGMLQGITNTQICATIIMEDDQRYFKMPRPLEVLDGAPLQAIQNNDHCMYTIIGLSHFKPTWGLLKVPLVFTRIYPYLAWIEQNVWPESLTL
ncbi:serine protease snake-like [Sitodiplosis mosellana]|uniref:serine protease snake-like n=1 Tax=Sitodiplosis mosellana TaxID=263140 RepID=UPI0024447A31|nr:serine protease snake-like [Sitodiplosis mosellana]